MTPRTRATLRAVDMVVLVGMRRAMANITSINNLPRLRNSATRNSKHRSSVQCDIYFDILNRLGVDYECDGRTDGQTDRLAFSNNAL